MRWELPEWVKEKPAWFFDLGPGLPGTEANWARQTWPEVNILGLEPFGPRFDACLPHFPGRLLKVAAWNTDVQSLSFFVNERSNLWGLFAPPELPKAEEVAGRSLDSLDREYGPFDKVVIWADIEGSELRMLQGAVGLLSSHRIIALNLEVRPVPFAEGWCIESEVDAFLKQFGFHRARTYAEQGRGHHYDVIYIS